MLNTVDMFETKDSWMITRDPAPAKKRGTPKASDIPFRESQSQHL